MQLPMFNEMYVADTSHDSVDVRRRGNAREAAGKGCEQSVVDEIAKDAIEREPEVMRIGMNVSTTRV